MPGIHQSWILIFKFQVFSGFHSPDRADYVRINPWASEMFASILTIF